MDIFGTAQKKAERRTMSGHTLYRLPIDLLTRATERATTAGTTLDAVLRAYLTAYASGTTAQQAGGRARAKALSPETRSIAARKAALARWHHG